MSVSLHDERMRSNEKEISRQGVVTNTLNLFRDGAVGFIDWLDLDVANTMTTSSALANAVLLDTPRR